VPREPRRIVVKTVPRRRHKCGAPPGSVENLRSALLLPVFLLGTATITVSLPCFGSFPAASLQLERSGHYNSASHIYLTTKAYTVRSLEEPMNICRVVQKLSEVIGAVISCVLIGRKCHSFR
jgi:hypothetical protein